MRAMLTVAGKDRTGVIAKISNTLFEHNVNIVDVRQNIMGGDLFAMIMLVDTSKCSVSFAELANVLKEKGEESCLSIRIQREDIFDAMHRI